MTGGSEYRLLKSFEQAFDGVKYRHRSSTVGDKVAVHLYEDLLNLGRSKLLAERMKSKEFVVNVQNVRRGVKARRGDGTFGEKIPNTPSVEAAGFLVARGQIATVEI